MLAALVLAVLFYVAIDIPIERFRHRLLKPRVTSEAVV